jgi:hypothetical protein
MALLGRKAGSPARWARVIRVYFDTEFTNFQRPELISIGLVSDDGAHEFYAERTDFKLSHCSDFVRGEVLPLLGRHPSCVAGSGRQVSNALCAWLDALPCREVELAADYKTDFELLDEILFERRQPGPAIRQVDCSRLSESSEFTEAYVRYFLDAGRLRHHALHDARALRHAAGSSNQSRHRSFMSMSPPGENR